MQAVNGRSIYKQWRKSHSSSKHDHSVDVHVSTIRG